VNGFLNVFKDMYIFYEENYKKQENELHNGSNYWDNLYFVFVNFFHSILI